MQFMSQKNNLLAVSLVFISSFAYANQTISIKQVSKERIERHAKHIRGVMMRRNIVGKVGIAGVCAYALYTLGSWFKGDATKGAENRVNPDVENQNVENQSAVELRLQRLENEHRVMRNQLLQSHSVSDLNKSAWQKTFDTCKRTGKHAFQWIGMPILFGMLGNKFHSFMGFTQSIELFDQNTTHCMELLQYLVYNIQEIADFINSTGQQISLDKKDFAATINRLISSIEKIIGFMRAKSNTFKQRLKDEATSLEKRLTDYAEEFAGKMDDALKTVVTDYRSIAQSIARFGQRYAQERQRFAFIEAEAQ